MWEHLVRVQSVSMLRVVEAYQRPSGATSSLHGSVVRAALIVGLMAVHAGAIAAVVGPDGQPVRTPSAAGVEPREEYAKHINSRRSLAAFGDDLFGDAVNLYTGTLSFAQTDVEIPGNSDLPVSIRRTLAVKARPYFQQTPMNDQPFADWELDIPRLVGTWGVRPAPLLPWAADRCSNLKEPGEIEVFEGTVYYAQDYWSGVQAEMPGGGELMVADITTTPRPQISPAPAGGYPWMTPGYTYFSCVPNGIEGDPSRGEAFRAVTADGVTYEFNRLAEFDETRLATPMAGTFTTVYPLSRRRVALYATLVTDRFGNWVRYHFVNAPDQPARLRQIEASDGRALSILYNGNGHIETVVESADAQDPAARRWHYQYEAVPELRRHTLVKVIRPDDTRWEFQLQNLSHADIRYKTDPKIPPRCHDIPRGEAFGPPVGGQPAPTVGTVIHPSGAVGSFRVKFGVYGRGAVRTECNTLITGSGRDLTISSFPIIPFAIGGLVVDQKSISGPGIAEPMTWDFQFDFGVSHTEPPGGPPCASPICATVTKAEVLGPSQTMPDGTIRRDLQRITYGSTFLYDEDRLTRIERGWQVGNNLPEMLDVVDQTFVLPSSRSGGALQPIATSLRRRGDGYPSMNPRPRKSRIQTRQGVEFREFSDQFDAFWRPQSSREESSVDGNPSRTWGTEYHDNYELWVVGQRQRTTLDGVEVDRTFFDARAQPFQTFRFGQRTGTMTYHGPGPQRQSGRLHVFKDARNHDTFLEDWHRGVPRLMRFPSVPPSVVQQSAVVNDRGWITSVTDENGFTTSYDHDEMGRLKQIDYPTGDTIPWAAETFALTRCGIPPSSACPFALAPGHWVWARSHGAQRENVYLDALWRPVVEERFDATNKAGTQSQTVKFYDTAGRLSFVSRPQRGLPNDYPVSGPYLPPQQYPFLYPGTITEYDALDRVRQTAQDSELGPLVTQIDWFGDGAGGFQQRVTNPRGFATTTSYQVFATPTTDFPLKITEPEGVTTTISRDVFGKPKAMFRQDVTLPVGGKTLLRSFVYDDAQRLCKEIHPESGASIYWYDEAGNRTDSLTGSALTTPGTCSREDAPKLEATRTDFDEMNRPKFVDVPGAGQDTTITYTPDGLTLTILASSATGGWRWTYQYNKRRLLTNENFSLSNGQLPATIAWNYNGLGHVSGIKIGGALIDYSPDALGNPTRAGDYATSAVWGPDGQLEQFLYGNGTLRTITRSPRGLPKVILDRVPGGARIIRDEMDWDANGNLRTHTDVVALENGVDGSRLFDYDARDRLENAHYAGTGHVESYWWDAFDRLRTRTVGDNEEIFNYDFATKRLQSISSPAYGTRSYGHDARGNVTSRPGFNHVYDAANRLVQSVRVGGGVESYEYDGHGRRTMTDRSGGPRTIDYYTHDGKLRARADTGLGGTTTYVYLGDLLVAQDAGQWPDSMFGRTYFHTDHLGTPVALTDHAGAVIERIRRESFGQPLAGPLKNGPGYTGHMEDPGTGLVYMQQRYYDPAIARFLSVDPVGPLADPSNHFGRYHYALNNPYRYTDPDGRVAIPWEPIGQIAATRGAQAAVASQLDSPVPGPGDVVGAVILVGAVGEIGYKIYQANQSETPEPEFTDVEGNKPPFPGEPGSTVRGGTGSRTYGEDGYPLTDRDLPHPDEKGPGSGDHVHDWGRPEGGGPPTNEDRGIPRDPVPGDPPPPRGPNTPLPERPK